MAELLVFNREHWMDKLDEKQLAAYVEKYPKFMDKYNARTQKGDIVQIEDDGHFKNGYDKRSFDLVIIKDKTKKELQYLIGPLLEDAWTMKFDDVTMTSKAVYTPMLKKKFKATVGSVVDNAEVALTSVTIKTLEVVE
ncbi:MAG: hypothetical protein H7831_06920 [Magnetococcus sp. WYHC-3]